MDLGLACHVCGTLNQLSAQTCSRCGTVLVSSAANAVAPQGQPETSSGAEPPPSGVDRTVFAPSADRPPSGVERTVFAPSSDGPPSGVERTVFAPSSSTARPQSGVERTVFAPSSDAPPRSGVERTVFAPQGATGPGAPPVEPGQASFESMQTNPQRRFDPATGKPLDGVQPHAEGGGKTLFFGALQQQPVVPRLVVIKGEGGDGATYHLQGTTTTIGRSSGEITFAEDPFLSPEHAKFTAQNSRLFVQDLESANGVFLRIKRPVPLGDGSHFLVGEQLLRVEMRPFTEGQASRNGTYYYGSPRPNGRFQVVQCLAGGGEGRIATAQDGTLTLGRENNTLNFPDDRFISGHHARLELMSDQAQIMLTDTGSRNGTFVRLDGAQELFHGDYLFVGQQLLRVEIA